MEDVSMVAQIEGFKHEQLLFVDEVLKQLGELALLVVFFFQPARYPGSALAKKQNKKIIQAALWQKNKNKKISRQCFGKRIKTKIIQAALWKKK